MIMRHADTLLRQIYQHDNTNLTTMTFLTFTIDKVVGQRDTDMHDDFQAALPTGCMLQE
jgi:hypothetical protein